MTGIIPAYAGSTPCRRSAPSSSGDHSRVCGEHPFVKWLIWDGEGSSPRMRGALTAAGGIVKQVGIIPAYAGSTFGGH